MTQTETETQTQTQTQTVEAARLLELLDVAVMQCAKVHVCACSVNTWADTVTKMMRLAYSIVGEVWEAPVANEPQLYSRDAQVAARLAQCVEAVGDVSYRRLHYTIDSCPIRSIQRAAYFWNELSRAADA